MRGFMIENDKKWSGVRTDLALEEQERFQEERVEIRGVEVHEWEQEQEGIKISQVIVKTEDANCMEFTTIQTLPLSLTEIREAAAIACVDHSVMEFTHGYDTTA